MCWALLARAGGPQASSRQTPTKQSMSRTSHHTYPPLMTCCREQDPSHTVSESELDISPHDSCNLLPNLRYALLSKQHERRPGSVGVLDCHRNSFKCGSTWCRSSSGLARSGDAMEGLQGNAFASGQAQGPPNSAAAPPVTDDGPLRGGSSLAEADLQPRESAHPFEVRQVSSLLLKAHCPHPAHSFARRRANYPVNAVLCAACLYPLQ